MTEPAPLPLDSQLCFSIYSAAIAINRAYKPMLDALGVTYTQYLAVSTLWEQDGLSISAIADRLGLEPSTITPAVKRLEAAGFLSRRRSTVDERLVEVFLTEKGKELHPEDRMPHRHAAASFRIYRARDDRSQRKGPDAARRPHPRRSVETCSNSKCYSELCASNETRGHRGSCRHRQSPHGNLEISVEALHFRERCWIIARRRQSKS